MQVLYEVCVSPLPGRIRLPGFLSRDPLALGLRLAGGQGENVRFAHCGKIRLSGNREASGPMPAGAAKEIIFCDAVRR
jgi:hypothetical protein